VLSGWVELSGRPELESRRPLLPGAGIAVGVDAKLNLDVEDEKDYSPPVLGTLGGYYSSSGGEVYGVTCAHCLQKSKEPTLHENGTYVYQPSAMGLIVNAANKMSAGKLGEYERCVQQLGHLCAMRWLTEELRDDADFTTELSGDAKCGEVIGGVLGALQDNGPVVDVGLVRLDADIIVAERCTLSKLIPASPPLKLYAADARSKILEVSAFPDRTFEVYGRGARSIDTMEAFVNPLHAVVYIRPFDLSGLTFMCIQAETKKNWVRGDSGTWCWTKEGLIVGMGMGYACIENRGYCCIMQMSNVLAAIEQIIRTVV